jgi:hypothetical protein
MAKGEKDPVEELKKGVDFLFKAAKHAVEELPTEPIESLVKTSVKEVGRAMNNVKDTVLHEVAEWQERHKSEPAPPPEAPAEAASTSPAASAAQPSATPPAASPPAAPSAATSETPAGDEGSGI